MSKASDHPKLVQAKVLLRELAHEFELGSRIAEDKGSKEDAKAFGIASRRCYSALDHVSRLA